MPDVPPVPKPCKAAVIWIDWYAYHVARFRGMHDNPALQGFVQGIELVGGIGVHQGLKFREDLPADLPIETLMPHSSWQDAGQLTLARKLWAALTRIDPAVVLIPGYYTLPAIAAALWAKLHRRAGVLMTESTAEDHVRNNWKEAFKSTLIRNLFDWAICGGEAHLRYLKQLSFPENRIAFSYDIVDNSFFASEAATLRQLQNWPSTLPGNYFLYVGRLSPEKNIDGLLRAYAEYRRQRGTWSLVLVGAGPSEKSLRTLAENLGIARDLYFAGMKTYRELPIYYSAASCFILPSTREPWGLVVNEAMASGLPVIVSHHCGCAPSLVDHNRNGFIFNPTDTKSFLASLTAISSLSSHQLSEFSNHSRSIVSNYSPRTFGSEVQKIVAATQL